MKISITIPHRGENPTLLANTVKSFCDAGADEVLAIEDTTGKGPAWGRNKGATESTGDVVAWSDSHCLWVDGDFRAFCRQALDGPFIMCAPTSSMDDPDRFTAYGAELREDPVSPGYRLSINRRPTNAPGALYGSVYAMSRKTFQKLGGWPKTISWGYNEQALSLCARYHGVSIKVDVSCRILHKFRKRFPYPVRGLDPLVNRMIAHKLFETPEEWADQWAPRFKMHRQAWRRFQKRKVAS